MSEIKIGTNGLIEAINDVPLDFDNGPQPIHDWAEAVTGLIDHDIIENTDSSILEKIGYDHNRKAKININNSSIRNMNGFYIIKSVDYIYIIAGDDFELSFTAENPAEYGAKKGIIE